MNSNLIETYTQMAWRKYRAERNGLKPLPEYEEALITLRRNNELH